MSKNERMTGYDLAAKRNNPKAWENKYTQGELLPSQYAFLFCIVQH
jgi:hypothetical protein